MVLTSQEYETARNETCAGKLLSLFQLRERTSSFLIQCLADREIQTLLDTDQKKAYHYNCAVIHNPHAWSQFPPVKNHGWNSSKNQPIDPKLKIGRVLGQQNNTRQNIPNIEKNPGNIQQLEEVIFILKEENTIIKRKYQESLEALKSNSNSTVSGSVGQLQRQVQNMRLELQTKTNTIQLMEKENRELKQNISSLNANLVSAQRRAREVSLERQQGCCIVM